MSFLLKDLNDLFIIADDMSMYKIMIAENAEEEVYKQLLLFVLFTL